MLGFLDLQKKYKEQGSDSQNQVTNPAKMTFTVVDLSPLSYLILWQVKIYT
jgi:hypothetical protein